jgi:chromosome segregation ATPase
MNINQLSANIDTKLVQLEQQLEQLERQLAQNTGDNAELNTELKGTINTLEQLKLKLIKSREIAWRAHELQSNTEPKQSQQTRMIGLALCVISGLGFIAIVLNIILR